MDPDNSHVVQSIRHQDAKALAAGYTSQFRWVEILAIVTFAGFMVALTWKLWAPSLQSPWLALLAILLGYIAADFVSGFVHWLADTWGSTDMPLLGKTLIRPFREHHVDQEAITHHDFVETNGANCLISIPTAVIALVLPTHSSGGLFASAFLSSMILWVFGTNQFHKWSHMKHPPRLVGWLQKLHLVLPPGHHAVHHAPPYNKYYCITVGWLNAPLYWIRFFQALEWLVTATTGLLPRQDDIGEYAARAIAPPADPVVEPHTRLR